MKYFKLTLLCLTTLAFCFCNNKKCNQNTQTATKKINFTENAIVDTINRQKIVNFENIYNEFTMIYTMKKKDSTLIGDVYVKFENDSLFRYLYVVNDRDTLYSIKRNVFYYKDGTIDIKGANSIYGYTFFEKENDRFYITPRYENGNYVTDDARIEWNYDDDILEFFKI